MSAKRWLALAVSGAVAVVLLAVGAWMLLGRAGSTPADTAVQIIPPAEVTTQVASPIALAPAPAGSPAPESAPAAEVVVYITGAVVNPGVYTVTTEQRLDAVLTLAGGPTDDADLSRVNLAAYVSDATHYTIPSVHDANTEGGQSASSGAAPAPPQTVTGVNSCAAPIDINTADAACLESLPGIGSVRAEAIVAHREQHGPFAIKQDITDVSGIGDGTYRRISEMIVANPQ